MPGGLGSNPSYLQTFNGYLYFAAAGIDTSWMPTLGSRDICGSFRISSFDSRVAFAVSDSNVWIPKRTYDCPPGYHWASTEEGYMFFTSPTGNSIHEASSQTYAGQCGWIGDVWDGKRRMYFRFSDSVSTGAYKDVNSQDSYRPDIDGAIYRGQLTTDDFAGIVCVVGAAYIDSVSSGNGADCTSSTSAGSGCIGAPAGTELWRTDGTVEGTLRIDDIYPGSPSSFPAYLTSFGAHLYFAATDNRIGSQRRLYRTTGELAQAEVLDGPITTTPLRTSTPIAYYVNADPADLTVAVSPSNQLMFYTATDEFVGRELFFINITGYLNITSASQLPISVIDIVAGADSSNPQGFTSSGGQLPVLFQAYTPGVGTELWVTDGTYAGTTIVMDICPGAGSSNPLYLTWYNQQFYFQADDCVHGTEMWISQGTATTTVLLMDIRPGSPGSSPSFMTIWPSALNGYNYLVFTALDGTLANGVNSVEGVGGSQIWITTGYVNGTRRALQNSANDIYVDRPGLDADYPPTLGVLGNALYIPGNVGDLDFQVPSGGFRLQVNEIYDLGYNQAAVIGDVDTPTDGQLTVTLSVDVGLVAMNVDPTVAVVVTGSGGSSSSTPPVSVLIVDSMDTERMLVFNALINLGCVVDAAKSGEAAFAAVKQRALDAAAISKQQVVAGNSSVPQMVSDRYRFYDLILVSFTFPNFSGNAAADIANDYWYRMDGVELVRTLRTWESVNRRNITPTQIYVMSTFNRTDFARQLSLSAGADQFLLTPPSSFLSDAQLYEASPAPVFNVNHSAGFSDELWSYALKYGTNNGPSSTILQTMATGELMQEVMTFSAFAALILQNYQNSLPSTAGYATVSTLPSAITLSSMDIAALPSQTYGSSITIVGTLRQINNLMSSVFYYAPIGTAGTNMLTFTATDMPMQCQLPANIGPLASVKSTDPRAIFRSPPTQHALLQPQSFNASATTLCDTSLQTSNTVSASIPFYVLQVNQPPTVALTVMDFTANVDIDILVPLVTLVDVDHHYSPPVVDSSGIEQIPPISVTVTVVNGTVGFGLLNGLGLPQGSGTQDQLVSLNGPLNLVNNALATMLYVCVSTSPGCVEGYTDTITIFTNDEGFSGQGGPLTATATITVNLVGKPIVITTNNYVGQSYTCPAK